MLKNKEQQKEYSKKYYNENRKKIIKYQKEYRRKNPEKRKEHYIKNKEKANKQSKEYYIKNKIKNREKKKEYDKKYRENNKEEIKEYYFNNKERIKKRAKKFKKWCVEYKGGKCQMCGYDNCLAALEFHHIGEKSFDISRAVSKEKEVLEKELDKCILLCANCHRIIHHEENKFEEIIEKVVK